MDKLNSSLSKLSIIYFYLFNILTIPLIKKKGSVDVSRSDIENSFITTFVM